MTRLFLKKFDIFFQSNSYELLRTSKEKREKQKKMAAITDWNGLVGKIRMYHDFSYQNFIKPQTALFIALPGLSTKIGL